MSLFYFLLFCPLQQNCLQPITYVVKKLKANMFMAKLLVKNVPYMALSLLLSL